MKSRRVVVRSRSGLNNESGQAGAIVARLSVMLTAFSLLCVGLVATPGQPAQAIPSSGFKPGNIISDALFYQGDAMTSAQVQLFLDQRVPRCTIGDPGKPAGGTYYFPGGGSTVLATKCLKDAVLPSRSMAASPYCSGYAGNTTESAATIVQKVGRACGISQRVLLVMLEKEQSLVQDSFPAQHQFDRAMGYACPDSGPGGSANCNSQYYGFFNQVYFAAWQYKVYKAFPNNYRYKPFQSNSVQWHPNIGCGTSNLYIENRATASLYIYTPYRPNQAALNAGWGTGDACSSYGNRNFYNFYTTWFGSPTLEVDSHLVQAYKAAGGETGQLGRPLSPASNYANGAIGQGFQGGSIYWSTKTGAHAVYTRPIRDHYWANGSWAGVLGFPNGTENKYKNGGVGQGFAGGSIYAGPKTGSVIVRGPVREEYWRRGSVSGVLGYPVSKESLYKDGGRGQGFENGSVYWSATTGGRSVSGKTRETFWNLGSISGQLGYPKGDLNQYASGGTGQAFVGGSVYGRTGAEAFAISGGMLERYWAQRSTTGVLRYPTGPMLNYRSGGHGQPFEGGSLYQSPGGSAWEVTGSVLRRYWELKSTSGVVGYPIAAPVIIGPQQSFQRFERGSVFQESKDSAWEVVGPMLEAFEARGSYLGELGFPIAAQYIENDGVTQRFRNGSMHIDSAGLATVRLSNSKSVSPEPTQNGSSENPVAPQSEEVPEVVDPDITSEPDVSGQGGDVPQEGATPELEGEPAL